MQEMKGETDLAKQRDQQKAHTFLNTLCINALRFKNFKLQIKSRLDA